MSEENKDFIKRLVAKAEKNILSKDAKEQIGNQEYDRKAVIANLTKFLKSLEALPESLCAAELKVGRYFEMELAECLRAGMHEGEFKDFVPAIIPLLDVLIMPCTSEQAAKMTVWRPREYESFSGSAFTVSPSLTLQEVKPCFHYFTGGGGWCLGEELAMSGANAMNSLVKESLEVPGERRLQALSGNMDLAILTNKGITEASKTANKFRLLADPDGFFSAEARFYRDSAIVNFYQDEAGMPLPEDQLYRNMSMLNFLGYSSGAAFVKEIENALREKLFKLYGKAVAEKALSCVSAATVGQVASINKRRERGFTYGNFMIRSDRKVADSSYNIEMFENVKPIGKSRTSVVKHLGEITICSETETEMRKVQIQHHSGKPFLKIKEITDSHEWSANTNAPRKYKEQYHDEFTIPANLNGMLLREWVRLNLSATNAVAEGREEYRDGSHMIGAMKRGLGAKNLEYLERVKMAFAAAIDIKYR